MKILFTDPDDPTGQRLIYMKDFFTKIAKRTHEELPFFFDGVVVDEKNNIFDYMFTKEDFKKDGNKKEIRK